MVKNTDLAKKTIEIINEIEDKYPDQADRFDLAKRRIQRTGYVSPRFYELLLKEKLKFKERM